MSSAQRSFAQIGARIKFFIAVQGTDYFYPSEDATRTAVMTEAEFLAATHGGPPGRASSLYRDLGESVTTYIPGSGSLHLNIYRLVQRVNGATTEGVSGDEYDIFYIRTWSADPATYPVTVARVG